MQFRVGHLLLIITLVATMFGLYRLHPAMAAFGWPLLAGGMTGFLVAQTLEGTVLGSLSGALCTAMLACTGGTLFFLLVMEILSARSAPDEFPVWVVAVCFGGETISAAVGGYLGGRASLA